MSRAKMYVTVKITDGRGRVKAERTARAPRQGDRAAQAAALAARASAGGTIREMKS